VVTGDDGAKSLGISPIHHLSVEPRNDEWSSEGVDAIAWSPDGKTIVAAAYDMLSIWDTKVSIRDSPEDVV
jgi:WD40 repeat protein